MAVPAPLVGKNSLKISCYGDTLHRNVGPLLPMWQNGSGRLTIFVNSDNKGGESLVVGGWWLVVGAFHRPPTTSHQPPTM
jgi:hypothetical protein